jgi:CxxC motif-containing protein (DUF1111 family)
MVMRNRRMTVALASASATAGLALVAGALLLGHAGVPAPANDPTQRGAAIFATPLTPDTGLGPLYNGTACIDCHASPAPGGMGKDGLSTVLRVGQLTDGGFDPLVGQGGPVARAHSVTELGASCDLMPGIPPEANVTSVRNAPSLFGDGLIDTIPDEAIVAGAVAREDGVQGRVNLVNGRVGRFGWKADTVTLQQFVADAFRNEHGVTNPGAPEDHLPALRNAAGPCAGESSGLKDDGSRVSAVAAYVGSLPAPQPASVQPAGEAVFEQIGCASCHTPSLSGVPLYSDLLLHDMGRTLDDKVVQADARGQDWRTTPLWGLGSRQRFLHDGRARTIQAAITAHSGEADPAVTRFRALSPDDRQALLAFLSEL